MRGVLKEFADEQFEKDGYTLNAANEIEGFLFNGLDAERDYHETGKFEYVNTGGYYHSLPGDPLRTFIDTVAEVQRAMGFENEKDHPEVAPSQFEINYSYGEVVAAADQIQLYKLICRQVATQHGHDGELPAQARRRRQRQRHAHQRLGQQGRQEPVLGSQGRGEAVSDFGWEFVDRILTHGNDICLLLNSSVNAYRRLDPHFEAPNQIKASAGRPRLDGPHPDRQRAQHARRSPLGRARRQSVHGACYSVFKTGLEGDDREDQEPAPGRALPARQHLRRARGLPRRQVDHEAPRRGRQGPLRRSQAGIADRCPRLLGTFVKAPEVQFHHEVYNQFLWNQF